MSKRLYKQHGTRVYSMARVECHCALCSGANVWKIVYSKGAAPVYENDFGLSHNWIGEGSSFVSVAKVLNENMPLLLNGDESP